MVKVLITEAETGDVIIDRTCKIVIGAFSFEEEEQTQGLVYARNTDNFAMANAMIVAQSEVDDLCDRHPELEHLANYLKRVSDLKEMERGATTDE